MARWWVAGLAGLMVFGVVCMVWDLRVCGGFRAFGGGVFVAGC